jgi:hypothetical protein
LRRLQAGGISLIETNVEWKKYDYRANTEKLLCKTFGSTKIAYSTSDEHVEESYYKPGGTVTAALGHWASRVLPSGKDPTGCGRWSYICLGKNDKKFAILTFYRVGHNHNVGDATAFQQQYRIQYADETARVEINPHKQKMIDLEYFTEELKQMALKLLCSLMQTKRSIIDSARRITITSTSRTKDSILTAPSMVPSQHTLAIVV